MTPKRIQAFFAGTCRTCGRKVVKGEQIWFAKHYGIRCQGCGPHTSADAPLPARKGKRSAGRKPSARTQAESPVIAATRRSPRPPSTEPVRCSGFIPLYTTASVAARLPAEPGPDCVHRLAWASLTDLVDDAFGRYGQSADAKDFLDALHKRHAGDAWANGHDEASLRKAVHEPPAHLLAAIDAMRNSLVDSLALPTTTRRKVRRGLDWGDDLDADCYLARQPNAWEQVIRDPLARRSVTIGVNLTVACGQRPDELIHRGAAAVALADLLTGRGVNVRILGFSVGEDVSDQVSKLVSTVEFKAADMPLDVASLATAVCDVGFFRMVVMPAEVRHLPGRVSTHLGMRGGQYLPGPDRMALDYLVESRVTTRESALAWLHEQMAGSDAAEVSHV